MIHDIGARARSGSSRAIPAGCCLRRTRLGHVAVLWSVREGRPQIDRILLPTPQLPDEVRAGMARSRCGRFACPEIDLIADRIAALLAGEDVRFLADDVPLAACSPFQRKVLRACRRIPRGRVSSYRGIAERCGLPNGARAAGTALARNPFPLVIPCHRVVRSDGSLGGFGGGLPMKRTLLALEGVPLDARGRVPLEMLF